DMQRIVQAASDTPLAFAVERDGKTLQLVATPREQNLKTPLGAERVAAIGVRPKTAPGNWRLKTYGLFQSVRLAGSETWYVVARTGSYLKGLVLGQQPADQLSGPIRIAEVSGAMAKIGIAALLQLAAILSISVGLLNLLPVPLLDGGHLAYYAVEAIRGKAMNEKVQQFGMNVGIVLLAALMCFATYNDVLQLLGHWMHWR
ncbi:MAG: RIP metalloprotease RseP, partial [Methylocapsa sp.]|nr:RIP metalloprotease RseP [Methylocapsa sp.]